MTPVTGLDAVWLWNADVPSFINETVHELVHKQVKLRPHSQAVDAHDGTLTYAELDHAANSVAHHLTYLGIGAEDCVPLCFEKSRWAIVGILAVLKCGAGFVFLDPAHPVDRREYITSEVQAKAIVCSPTQSALFVESSPPTLILSENTLAKFPTQDAAPTSLSTPSNLLYIIFTSGSTGKPKGCMIENRAFLSGSIRHAERADIDHTTRILQLASYTFDVSMLEILTALVHGSCICTPDMALMANGPAYIVNEYKITWTFMTPSLVKLMAPSMVPTLKTLALGGEPLSKVDVETWAGHLQLINGYGPSECSVAATGNTEMTPETDPANIGYAVGGVCWIADAEDHEKLLPPGEVGELLIEGPILARGYLNNKEKTNEVFIERPAWGPTTKTGENRRFYKTGDLAKFLPDGSIYFIGRKDTQVKLRGLRIELGEIEHNIGTHPQVRHQMVILPKKGSFANRLVALVSLKDHLIESIQSSEMTVYVHEDMHGDVIQAHLKSIRETLVTKVPEYMVPETWIVIERFPLLVSGKLNRSLISNWVADADAALYREVVGIESEKTDEEVDLAQEQMRDIIAAVLNLKKSDVSFSKSFLSLGGDSITAMQAMSRCRSAGIAITVKDIIRSKSIAELALCMKSANEAAYSTEEIFDVPFELSPVQRMYFDIAPLEIDDSRQTRFNQSFFLKIEQPVTTKDVVKALDLIVIQHSMLRVRYLQQDGVWMQVIPSKVEDSYSFSAHDIATLNQAYSIMATTQTSLDTRSGPIFAVRQFNTKEGQYLFLVAHHVMIDLVSWRAILRDMEEIITTGQLTAPKPIPFQNWLKLQAEQARAADISSVLPYNIPAPDFEYWGMLDKPNRMCDTQETIVKLDLAQTKELLEGACHFTYNTEPIDILLASLVYSFNQIFSDRSVPALFREGHGREPWDEGLDISNTVGWFTTMYPVFVNMQKQFNIFDVIKRAKDVRHSVPANGRPYFASRYLNDAGIAKFGGHDRIELSFDYLGLYQQMERDNALLTQVSGYQAIFEDIAKEAPRFALVEITAEVLQGQMQLLFIYNKHMRYQDRLQSWALAAQECIATALSQLKDRRAEHTLSDFPLLKLNYQDLDTLITKMPEVGISDIARVQSIYPSSPMQHGLLLSQIREENGAYEYNHTLRVETRKPSQKLDVETLKAAWTAVVQRHSSLRTVFVESVSHAGLYDQISLNSVEVNIHACICDEDRVGEVFSQNPPLKFSPGGALHRFTICQVSSSTAICKLDINHAIIDGTSVAILVSDFVLAYEGRLIDRPGFAFEDYISYVVERPLDVQRDFWREYLAGATPSFVPLMAHWEDAVVPARKLNTVPIDIGISSADLTEFCQSKSMTLASVFQLAWGLLLKKYTGTDDVCFGYLSSGRDAPIDGIEQGVGAFITMLVSRMILNDSSTVSSALEKVVEDLTRTLPNQYCGLAEIHHALKLGNQPLFNTIVSIHRESDQEILTDSSIKVESIKGYDPTEYALALDVGMTETRIVVTLQSWTSDFTEIQAKNIGATLAEAVKAIVQQSDAEIGSLDLVSLEHHQQIQKITSVYPQYINECVHSVIELQAQATPDAEAICSYEGSWSYFELNDQANRLANYLISLGVGPEVIVPYVFEKSAWAIVSILAILKAGGAGVAFDPNHPIDRIEGLIEQTESMIVLTSSRHSETFNNSHNVKTVVIVNADVVKQLPESDGTPNTVQPENACFVVFTSGTTGKPKGIVLEHRNMRTCTAAMAPVLGFSSTTRALQFAAYNFDVSLQDILTTLQVGGTICVISDEERMNDLAGGINRTKANWADLTATVSGMLNPADVPSMKRLNNGGEPLNRDVVEKWADHLELYNLYGPAETTVNQTASTRLSRTSPASNIGPAYGTHVWIVNDQDHNRLVPMGCAGEILIEGPLLARGYLKEPEKTAAAFIENPAWVSNFPNPNATHPRRFYKSGDIGCLNSDGSITIVGRKDTQVKINGQRVELDEIMYQAQLLLPEDYSIVVDAIGIEEHTKNKTIIGFLTNSKFEMSRTNPDQLTFDVDEELRGTLKELQRSLSKVLPLYMVPSLFVPIFNIPYTTSGKLARATLRQIVAGLNNAQVAHYMLRSASVDQPSTPTEKVIQSLYAEILSLDIATISRDDNFFGLGGDSVGAMRLVAAARKRNVAVRVADLFKFPILNELANVAKTSHSAVSEIAPFSLLESKDAILAGAAEYNIAAEEIEDAYPTSALQEGMMALSLRKEGAYIAQRVFRLPNEFDISRFQDAWLQVVDKEPVLRTRIVPSAFGNVQIVSKLSLVWKVVDSLDSYLKEDRSAVFQYGQPLMRLAIVDNEYFVWTAHHAIYDGFSIALLFEKVAQAYGGQEVVPSRPFKAFISRLNQTAESESVGFWGTELATSGSFPASYPEVGLGYIAASKKTIAISGGLPTATSNIFPSTIKRAAWALTLATYADSDDIVFAQTLAGRNIEVDDVHDMIGPTITTIPVRVVVPKEGPTIRTFLESVQNQSVASIDYEHFGLQNIRNISPEARNIIDSITNLFVIQPAGEQESVLGLEAIARPEENFDTFPLVVLCKVDNNGFTLEAMYDDAIIPTEQMTRMLHQCQHFIQVLSCDIDRPMESMELLNNYDFENISTWNANLPVEINARIPDLIASNVAARPSTQAVCAWDGSLTYSELDLVTSRLANHLAKLGVTTEVRVGLCFDKSIWNLVSMFAVMRAGGVCVQLLPSYPTPRMLSILEDIEADVVLTSSEHAGIFEGVIPNVVQVNQALLDAFSDTYNTFEAPSYTPDNAAFVVFTSGSTGKPKGVVIEHRGFCTMAHYQLPKILLHSDSRVLQFATHTFDICLFESFAPLTKGACVCIPSEHDRMNNLVGAINSLNVDWIIMVSTVADTFHPDEVPGLKSIILGGEPLRADIHARWAQRVNLFNDYGPAECSILAVMTRSYLNTPCSMIGKAQGGRSWVVDKTDHNRLVPIGCVGELLIEGPLLARGYLKNQTKTDESYIYDPAWASRISPNPSRLYKTGDLVRYFEDGNMLCLGRKDTQIKIRGLRVELGEIEHHVKTSSFGSLKQAVEKILLENNVDKAALAAFIVPAASDIEGDSEVLPLTSNLQRKFTALKEHISSSLPSYMVPSLYIPVRKMPETQTNKIDRNALKRIGAGLDLEQVQQYSLGAGQDKSDKRAPSSSMEIALQNIWADLLCIDASSIGADDSFFAKGGDSIKAMRLTSMARSVGINIIVANIFQNPILCDMAEIAVFDSAEADIDIEPFALAQADGAMIEDAAAICSVPITAVEDIYPCTPLQEGLMELATQQEGAYTAQRVFKLRPGTDVKRFRNAWSQVVALHPILRTRIVLTKTSGSMQVVTRDSIKWQDEKGLAEYLASDKATFIKYGSPLARYALDSSHEHFIWTVHHALYDGHTANMVMEQLESLYNGNEVDYVPGYNRFIKFLTEVNSEDCQAFWKKQLGQGVPNSFPHLPTATYQPSPDSEVTRTIKIVRNDKGFVLSTILRAAWAIVTSRYMGSEDVAFAATNSGRSAPVQGIDRIVGPTIATVPIQLQIGSGITIADFLATVQKQSSEMIPFEHAGLQNIYGITGEKQNLKNLFVIQQPLGDIKESSLLEEILDKQLLRGFHIYAAIVECMVISEQRVDIELQFDKKALPEASAKVVLEQFEFVIQQLLDAPRTTLLENVGLVTPGHYKQMIEWNKLVDVMDVDDCVHNIFREQVRAQPDAIAVVSWDGKLTYKQLDEFTDRLAAHLSSLGVKPEYLVPMCFEKSMFTIVAMMATLKSGGACVHLGRNSPIDRMKEIIEQTGSSIILTDAVHAHKFYGVSNAVVIDQAMLDSLSAPISLPEVSHRNPAFVLFTSGSTGKPKGVVVEHGSLCTSSRAHGANRKVGPWTRLLQFAAYTFDVSVADIFTTLQRGGCICVPSEDERINNLAGAINRMSCNYAFLTPTVAGMLDPSAVPTLERLILGGELLTQDNVQRWAPVVDLIVSYGMTECSIHCVDAVPLTIESDPSDLGRPSGCHMWIVDSNDHNKLAPIGSTGELVIEGRMVSRGYLNDQAKTDAAFIVDPTWSQGTGNTRRMYKTGDLCKYSAEGTICYVNRRDFQVKHHGQRIELSEIEHHIVAEPHVNQAVVLLPRIGYFQKKLVVVLSLDSASKELSPQTQLSLVTGLDKGVADVQITAVRNYLATKVPDYMVPAVWIIVHAMPLTPNNKMDRVTTMKWLVEMNEKEYGDIIGGGEEGGLPATQSQQRLHDILCTVLGLPSINMNRSFLDLGGDSIAAMNVRAKCQTDGISLSVRDILTSSSISQLTVEASFGEDNEIDKPFELTGWQEAVVNSEQTDMVLVRLPSTTVPKLVRAIEALVQQHPMLRSRFSRGSNGRWIQTITKDIPGSYKLNTHAVHTYSDAEASAALLESVVDIERGPLFAVDFFDVSAAGSQAMALAIHPAVADIPSIKIILEDIYGLLQGKVLPAKKMSTFQSLIARSEFMLGCSLFKKIGYEKRAITFPSGVTSSLLGKANNVLGTEPLDILAAVFSKTWLTEFKTAPVLFILDDWRSERVVGQFNRIRSSRQPSTSTPDLLQLIIDAKDERVIYPGSSTPPQKIHILFRGFNSLPSAKSLQHPSLDVEADFIISPSISNGELTVEFTWNIHGGSIQGCFARVIADFEASVPAIIRTLSGMQRIPTRSDFPLLDINNSQLTQLEKIMASASIPFSNVDAIHPCTPLQQRMLDSQAETSGSYQSDTVHKVSLGSGTLDIARLQNAWKKVTQRHEALRTVFIPSVTRKSKADQLILKSYDPEVNIIECDDSNIDRITANHHAVSHSECKPHVGFTLFQTPSAIYSKLEISHALQDGMSTRIIYQDLVLAYQGLLPGGNASGFREHVHWMAEQNMAPSHDFWSKYLEKVAPCRLPYKSDVFNKGTNILIPIRLDVSSGLINKLCRTHKFTPATLFQAAWVAVLHSVTKLNDVLFGYMTANRDLNIPGVDEIVGPMINMLACRLDITPDTSIKGLLEQTHASFLETLDHQHGFVATVEESAVPELPFNSVLSIEYAEDASYYPTAAPGQESLDFETVGGTRAPEFDVVLGVLIGDSIDIQLGYWNNVVDGEDAKNIATMYASVVEELIHGGLEGHVGSLKTLV